MTSIRKLCDVAKSRFLNMLPNFFVQDGDNKFHDLQIKTADGATFSCHSAILTMALNPGFSDIFKSGWQDETGPLVYVIVPDMSSEDTRDFLEFVYGVTPNIDLKSSNGWFAFVNKTSFDLPYAESSNVYTKVEEDFEPFVDDFFNSDDSFFGDTTIEVEKKIKKRTKKFEAVNVKSKSKSEEGIFPLTSAPSKSDSKPIVIGLMNHRAEIWKCPEKSCLETGIFQELWTHVQKDHKESSGKLFYTCEKCGESYKLKHLLLNHIYGNSDCSSPSVLRKEELMKYQCQECPMRFVGARNLEVHVNIQHLTLSQRTLHSQWATYFCEICWRYYQDLELFLQHQESAHCIRKGHFKEDYDSAIEYYKLDLLTMKKGVGELKQAKENNTEKKSVQINVDKVIMTTVKETKVKPKTNEEIRKENAKYHCITCNRHYTDRVGFSQHLARHHQKDKTFSCKKCGKGDFPTKFVMVEHKKACGLDYACKFCGKKYTKLGLVSHITMYHTEDRQQFEKVVDSDGKIQYKCDECNKCFQYNYAVGRHKAGVHQKHLDGPKKYVCQEKDCKYATNVKENLMGHAKLHNVPNHVCEHCGNRYANPDNLKRHKTMNHSSENLMCTVCPKTFTNRISFRNHLQTHGEAKLKCEKCEKMFVMPFHLKQHLKTHSDERPFPCKICGKAFKVKNKMQRHLQVHMKS